MATEIERKFLLCDATWRTAVERSSELRQGYLAASPASSVRVRVAGPLAMLNIKSATLGISRQEFEYPIPLDEANEILDTLCQRPFISKTRHYLPIGEHMWEIDEFHEENAGLIVAEIELASLNEPFQRPSWLGEEVSQDTRYYNSCLVEHPYCDWQ